MLNYTRVSHNNNIRCTLSGYKPPNMHRWGPGVRDIYALHYIESGRGTLETQKANFLLRAGDSFIIFPDTEVYYYPDPTDPWEYVWIEFKGDEVDGLLSLTELEPNKPVVKKSPENLGSLFPVINNREAQPFEKVRDEAQLRLLLSLYMEYYPKETLILDYVERAKEYIENNYWRTNLSVLEIVNAVNLERSYLFRLFKEATSMSISSYLTARRIQRASELLCSNALSIKSVACSVGYQDQLYFSKVFKKTTSYTPTEYMTLFAKESY